MLEWKNMSEFDEATWRDEKCGCSDHNWRPCHTARDDTAC